MQRSKHGQLMRNVMQEPARYVVGGTDAPAAPPAPEAVDFRFTFNSPGSAPAGFNFHFSQTQSHVEQWSCSGRPVSWTLQSSFGSWSFDARS